MKKSVIKRKKKPTILVPLLIAFAVAYFFYTGAEKKASEVIQPVMVPTASERLNEHTKIEQEHIAFRELPARAIPPNAIMDPNELIGKYVGTKYTIAVNSLFYEETLVDFEEIPSRISMLLNDDDVGLTMRVNLEKSVANSLRDNMYVQVRFFTNRTPSGRAFEGVLEERIKILAVRDGTGSDVGGTVHDSNRVPTVVVFEADEEQASYLIRASALGDLNILAISENEREIEEVQSEEIDETEEQIKEIIDMLNETIEDETVKEEQIKVLMGLMNIENDTRTGEKFTGNEVKLFIDSMTHTIENTITNYFVTPKGEVVVYDEELGELRYFESRERFMESRYVLQEMTDQEIEQFFEGLESNTSSNTSENTTITPTNTSNNNNTNSDSNSNYVFRGSGNHVTERMLLVSGINTFSLKHQGDGAFNVFLIDESGRKTELLKHKGRYEGQKVATARETGFYVLEIEASGIWEIRN